MGYRFTALQDFNVNSLFEDARPGERVEHGYVKDLSYTVRDGNTKLHNAVQIWVAAGRVTLGDATLAPVQDVQVRGTGTVGE